MNVKLSAGFPIKISQASINGLIHLVAALSLCKGVPKDESYFPPSFMEETLSNSFSPNITIIMRSKTCKQIVDWLAKKSICKTCSDSIYVRKKREKKHKLSDLNGEDENKENKKVCKAPTKTRKASNSDGKSYAHQSDGKSNAPHSDGKSNSPHSVGKSNAPNSDGKSNTPHSEFALNPRQRALC